MASWWRLSKFYQKLRRCDGGYKCSVHLFPIYWILIAGQPAMRLVWALHHRGPGGGKGWPSLPRKQPCLLSQGVEGDTTQRWARALQDSGSCWEEQDADAQPRCVSEVMGEIASLGMCQEELPAPTQMTAELISERQARKDRGFFTNLSAWIVIPVGAQFLYLLSSCSSLFWWNEALRMSFPVVFLECLL